MVDPASVPCASCGSASMATYVQLGSLFTRCADCGETGPAASWIGVADRLSGTWCACLAGPAGEPLELLAEGSGADLLEVVRKIAGSGALVRLLGRQG